MKRVPLSGKQKTIQAIWDWYEVQSTLSRRKRSEVLDGLHGDRPVSEPIFFGMSIEEIDEFFGELDYLAMLDLLAAAEAAIRLDFLNRVYERRKDDVSKHFRQLYKKQGHEVSLRDDILEAWKQLAPETRRAVGDFNGALNLRHWLAHGRYWAPRFGMEYSPGDVYDASHNLLEAIGA